MLFVSSTRLLSVLSSEPLKVRKARTDNEEFRLSDRPVCVPPSCMHCRQNESRIHLSFNVQTNACEASGLCHVPNGWAAWGQGQFWSSASGKLEIVQSWASNDNEVIQVVFKPCQDRWRGKSSSKLISVCRYIVLTHAAPREALHSCVKRS